MYLSPPLSLPSLRLLLRYTAFPTSTLDTAVVCSKSQRTVSVSIPYGEQCCIPSGESALVAVNKASLRHGAVIPTFCLPWETKPRKVKALRSRVNSPGDTTNGGTLKMYVCILFVYSACPKIWMLCLFTNHFYNSSHLGQISTFVRKMLTKKLFLHRGLFPPDWTLCEGPDTMVWWRGFIETALESTHRTAGPLTSTGGRYPLSSLA